MLSPKSDQGICLACSNPPRSATFSPPIIPTMHPSGPRTGPFWSALKDKIWQKYARFRFFYLFYMKQFCHNTKFTQNLFFTELLPLLNSWRGFNLEKMTIASPRGKLFFFFFDRERIILAISNQFSAKFWEKKKSIKKSDFWRAPSVFWPENQRNFFSTEILNISMLKFDAFREKQVSFILSWW